MPRYIDADALKLRIFKIDHVLYQYQTIVECIDSAPTIDPERLRAKGHWITEREAICMGDYSLRDTCSVCGRCDWDCTESASFKYCPSCGAKMEQEG